MVDNILAEIERIIKENEELKEKIITLETNLRNISMRERLYQSTLQATRTQLLKFAQGLTTTPHSSDAEYRQVVYGEIEQ